MASRRDLIRDHFSDVPELAREAGGFGALDGLGAANHYSVQPKMTAEGMTFQIVCDNCGQKNALTVEWVELVVAGFSRMPPNWKYKDGRMYPDVGCGNCRYLTTVDMTPDEAGKYVKQGAMAGYVSPQMVSGIQRQIQGPGR